MIKWRRPWAWPSELRARGVLGINGRNASYVLAQNPRAHYPRVDDKLRTKQFCESRGIRVPQTYAVIERQGDIRRLTQLIDGLDDFVVKPASGAEGRGILVLERVQGQLQTSGGEALSLGDLYYHVSAALSGLYSLAGQPDRVILEQRVVCHRIFAQVAVRGTPDIRIIIYRGIPVMAMARFPTVASRGRANLHQGAVAAGIDLDSGTTFGGVWQGKPVSAHPDTRVPITGLQIPQWHTLIENAAQLADALEMGYVGIDFVLDATLGPVVLEANARPGLTIQLANRRGLLSSLQRIESGDSPERQGWPRLAALQIQDVAAAELSAESSV